MQIIAALSAFDVQSDDDREHGHCVRSSHFQRRRIEREEAKRQQKGEEGISGSSFTSRITEISSRI